MPHYFVEPSQITGDHFTLTGDEAHHLLRVLRVKRGDQIDLFDGTGRQFRVVIDRLGEHTIEGSVLSHKTASAAAAKVHLVCSVPKGDRFDWLVEKCCEIGVAAITPLITARSSTSDISEAKLERWRRLSLAASKQCGRPALMPIRPCLPFADAIKTLTPETIALLPWEGEEAASIEKYPIHSGSEVTLFIGPEGGFTLQEIELARSSKILPVTLGRSILRVETAALVASVLALGKAGQFNHAA
jgi:16S rRNA (uracil1498-N3)-methyltransferase